MKILIGVLHSKEPQLEDCIKSIENQLYSYNYNYFILSGLNKSEAHDALYFKFMAESDNYDLFVKLDADMIIERQDFFQFLYSIFHNDTELDWLRLLIHDHFLNQNISGLNIYRCSVKWTKNTNNYFTDRVMIKSTVRKDLGIDPTTIWITHCKSGSMYQAFNFGFHRGVKSSLLGVSYKIILPKLQWIAFSRILTLIKTEQTRERLMILASWVYTFENNVTDSAINETNSLKNEAFSYLNSLTDKNLYNYILDSVAFKYLKIGFIGMVFYTLHCKIKSLRLEY